MINEKNTFYFIKHSDHIGRFIRLFSNQPYKPYKPLSPFKIKFRDFLEFIKAIFGYAVISFMIMLFFIGFSKVAVIICLTPTLLFIYIGLKEIWDYYKKLYHYKKELNSFPLRQSEWIKKLPQNYITYYKYIATKVKYRFNPETQVGKTASLLKNSLNKLNINVKQEAELLWKGLNLLPKRPKWRRRKNDGWYKQYKYTADFIYVDSEKGVMLDIEIDEEYHFNNYLQLEKDEQRNNVFLCNGWSIIRFKDSEIKKDPNRCAEDIKKNILQIELMHSTIYNILKQLQNTDLLNSNLTNEYYLDWIRGKMKEVNKEFIVNIEYNYESSVDYSSYQLEKYLNEYILE